MQQPDTLKSGTFTPIPVYLNSRRTGSLRVVEAIAQAINPNHQIRINSASEYLRVLKEYRAAAQQVTNSSSEPLQVLVPITFGKRRIRSIATRLMTSIVPGYSISVNEPSIFVPGYDLVVLHQDDKDVLMGREHFKSYGLPTLVNEQSLSKARAAMPNPARPGRELVTICIGGDIPAINYRYKYTTEEAAKIIEIVDLMSTQGDYDFVATLSRRTPPKTADFLRRNLAPRCIDFWPPTNPQNRSNPLMPWLAHAKQIIVTPDSMTMLCEAVDTGALVVVPEPSNHLRGQTRDFYAGLLHIGHIMTPDLPEESEDPRTMYTLQARINKPLRPKFGPHRGPLHVGQQIAEVVYKGMQEKWPTRRMVL